eukprot:3699407-Rhodomonas_salina.1
MKLERHGTSRNQNQNETDHTSPQSPHTLLLFAESKSNRPHLNSVFSLSALFPSPAPPSLLFLPRLFLWTYSQPAGARHCCLTAHAHVVPAAAGKSLEGFGIEHEASEPVGGERGR